MQLDRKSGVAARDDAGDDLSVEPREFAVDVTEGDGVTVVHVRGEVDLYTAPRLQSDLSEIVVGDAPMIVIDLSQLDFIDSTGLGVLVGALKVARASSGDVTLRNPSRSTHKILEIAGLTELFTIE